MKSYEQFNPNTNSYTISTTISASEQCQMAAYMRGKVYERAEKMLAKLLIRSLLRREKIDDLADSIDFNKVLVNSFKISIKEI